MTKTQSASQRLGIPQYWKPKVLARARAVHQELLALNEKIDTTFLEVGVRLKEIRDRHLYQPLNAPSFAAYVKTLKFSRSRAYALLGVVEDFYLSSRLDKSRLLAIGWEKLSMLRVIKDEELLEVWLEKAEQLGKRQLRQALYEAELLPRPEEPVVEEEEEAPEQAPVLRAPAAEQRPTYYLAVKKLSAVKRMSPEAVKEASESGKYPLILAVEGAVYAQQANLLGLPSRALKKEDMPVLDPHDPDSIEDESNPSR